MTVSSMATGCDVSESDVTGINVIRPKVGDYPWGVILIVRSVVWYSNGVFYHVRVLTVVSLLKEPLTEGYAQPPPLTQGYTPPPPPLTDGYVPS